MVIISGVLTFCGIHHPLYFVGKCHAASRCASLPYQSLKVTFGRSYRLSDIARHFSGAYGFFCCDLTFMELCPPEREYVLIFRSHLLSFLISQRCILSYLVVPNLQVFVFDPYRPLYAFFHFRLTVCPCEPAALKFAFYIPFCSSNALEQTSP